MLLMVGDVENAFVEFTCAPTVGVLLPSVPSEGECCGILRELRSGFGDKVQCLSLGSMHPSDCRSNRKLFCRKRFTAMS